jgi:hypothetical protein
LFGIFAPAHALVLLALHFHARGRGNA